MSLAPPHLLVLTQLLLELVLHPMLGLVLPHPGFLCLLHLLLLMMMCRLLEALLMLQATFVALLELGNHLVSIGYFPRIDNPLRLQYMRLLLKDNLARLETLTCIS